MIWPYSHPHPASQAKNQDEIVAERERKKEARRKSLATMGRRAGGTPTGSTAAGSTAESGTEEAPTPDDRPGIASELASTADDSTSAEALNP